MFPRIAYKYILTPCPRLVINPSILQTNPVYSACIKQRHYLKWTARKPSKVQIPGESSSTNQDNVNSSIEQNITQQLHKIKNQSDRISKPMHTVEDKEYETLKEDDTTFSNLMIQVGNRNERRKHRLMMLEGKRLNQDALNAGLKPHKLFFTQTSYLSELRLPHKTRVPLFKIPYKTIKLWSKLESPPGIVGFYSIPREGEIRTTHTLPVRVLCDSVREPGNMGSILRVAASVGCTEVILMRGCTDPWDSKVLRSASGGHFHIPIKSDLTWPEHTDFLNPNESIFLADNNFDHTLRTSQKLTQMLYYEPTYCRLNSVVVIIGGETEGVSQEALSVASKYNGTRVYIPMSNEMESLNTGSALGIVLFEIKRQFLLSKDSKTSETIKFEEEGCTEHTKTFKNSCSGT